MLSPRSSVEASFGIRSLLPDAHDTAIAGSLENPVFTLTLVTTAGKVAPLSADVLYIISGLLAVNCLPHRVHIIAG